MTEWHWLVQQAILGVDRSNFQIASATKQLSHENAVLRTLLDKAATTEPSTQFLHTAAIFNQLRCAGLQPHSITSQSTLAPCLPESQPPAPDKAASWLRQLLIDENVRLLCEWLTYANAAHAYVPHDTLPELLDLTMRQRQLAEYLLPCLGKRGRWLMTRNPVWQLDAALQVTESDWQTGNSQARSSFLRTLRQTESERARELLIATWKQEAAKDRVFLLSALAVNLSLADESFLESCLSDRSENVRLNAARLLIGLANSTMQKTLLSEIGKILRIERQWLRRTLQVTLPDTFAAEWNRFALKEKVTSGEKIGQKAWWLRQLLSLARPREVAHQLQVSSAELLDFVQKSDFAEVFLDGLLAGGEAHEEYDFLLLYLQQVKRREFPALFARYAALLPDSQREQCLQAYLAENTHKAFADWNEMTPVLQTFEQLSKPLSERLLREYIASFFAKDGIGYAARHALSEVAYLLAPAAYPHAEAIFQHLGSQQPAWVSEFLHIYSMRTQIEQAFQ